MKDLIIDPEINNNVRRMIFVTKKLEKPTDNIVGTFNLEVNDNGIFINEKEISQDELDSLLNDVLFNYFVQINKLSNKLLSLI